MRRFSWGRRSIRGWANWRPKHDATHAGELARWRRRERLPRDTGPRSLLLAALESSRDELLSAAALEHAAHIRAALGLPWPRRLLHFATSY
jgi:hypothetical protein